MNTYGLIGRSLGHSWSQRYFGEKFQKEGIEDVSYVLFELDAIDELPALLYSRPDICGLNVTIPFKEAVLPYLDHLDPIAEAVGAVNTIKIKQGRLTGYNTDVVGFRNALVPLLAGRPEKALVLGTGGAAKAVHHVLEEIGIESFDVSRTSTNAHRTYQTLTAADVRSHELIINCTPVGTFPNVEEAPPIPYSAITDEHILFDLVYNPEETLFMKKGRERDALVEGGLDMLILQAEESWRIWMK